jgi:hypothetical protein
MKEAHRLQSVSSPPISADELPGIAATPCAFSTLGKCVAKTDQRGGREPRTIGKVSLQFPEDDENGERTAKQRYGTGWSGIEPVAYL